jgi:hypothetical protein
MFQDCLRILAAIQRIEGYDRLLFKWWWLTLPVAALMIALAIWKAISLLVSWIRKPSDSPNKLFHSLAKVHNLTREELQLLTLMSEKLPAEMPRPVLFVEPSCWAWNQAPMVDKVDLGEKLFQKIFGFPPDRSQSK